MLELPNFQNHDIEADLVSDHRNIKKLTIDSKANLLQNNLAIIDSMNLLPINFKHTEVDKDQRNSVMADLSSSHNIQSSIAKNGNTTLISENLTNTKNGRRENGSRKIVKLENATKVKRKKLKGNHDYSALKPVCKKGKGNFFKSDTENQRKAALNYLSTGKENRAPKNDEDTSNDGCEIKNVKKRHFNVIQTTNKPYATDNSRMDTSEALSSKDSQVFNI